MQQARLLRDRHGQHGELALAEGQLAHVAAAQVADADALERRVDHARSVSRGPSRWCSCGIRPSATSSSTRIGKATTVWPGTTASVRASVPRSMLTNRLAIDQHLTGLRRDQRR